MAGKSGVTSGGSQRVFLIVSLVGWLAVIAVLALFMRTWIPSLKTDLAEIEVSETEATTLDGPLSAALQPGEPPTTFGASGSIHLPLYGSLYVGGLRSLKNLSATVSLRNISSDENLFVTSVQYFDEKGEAVADRLDEPHVLAPMAAAEFFVDQARAEGDPVATVVVGWGTTTSGAPPLAEAIIVGSYGAKSISFVTRGESRP